MNTRPGKNSSPASGIIRAGRSARFRCGLFPAFTLVEVLVAVAIIVTIVSMVYGSYFATSKSARTYQTRIALFKQGRKVLERMARQIRCSYVGPIEAHTDAAREITGKEKTEPENIFDYFSGDPDDPSGEILHLVTTNRTLCLQDGADGLFDITYKLDKSTGTLFLSQTRFINTTKRIVEGKNFRPLFEGVENIDLSFFDGHKWLDKWDFKQKRKLPFAVKIGITCEGENYQQSHYGTVAYVNCRKNQAKKTVSGEPVSVNKR